MFSFFLSFSTFLMLLRCPERCKCSMSSWLAFQVCSALGWEAFGGWCATHGDVSSGVASQDFLCLLRTCFWFLSQKHLLLSKPLKVPPEIPSCRELHHFAEFSSMHG